MQKMTPKERAITAFNLGIPDEVPTFELEFQLDEEFFGRSFTNPKLNEDNRKLMTKNEIYKEIYETAAFVGECYEKLDYAIIPAYCHNMPLYDGDKISDYMKFYFKTLKEVTKNERMLACHADGTYAIPDGEAMYDFIYKIADDPDGVKRDAEVMALGAIEHNKKMHEAGIDVGLLCSDYCYNSGSFLSPNMFSEFITPYLYKIIKSAREDGYYTVKHTDGNIMPILDQLVDCKPHALHSLDPMAGVDIKEVKRLVGNKVALCGNVHCAALQTGTEQDVIDSAEYCLTYGKEGGGYFFCTSNIPFKGMPAERYQLILDIWKRMRKY